MNRRIYKTVVLMVFLCQIPVFAAEKNKEIIPPPPPMANPLTVSVYTGRPAEIHLTVGGRIVEPLSFLIRKRPHMGVLGELKRTGRNTAVILYTPDPGAGPGMDSFSFAAKSADSPVSASATVRIGLVEEPARIEYPQELDFGRVFLGDTVERNIVVRNTGGAIAFWQIKPNPPWTIARPGSYKLAGGNEAVLQLIFSPTEERDFRDRIQMTPDSKSVLTVSGTGVPPVSWNNDGIVFPPELRKKGTAEMTLTNRTPEERKITMEWPEFLKAPGEITLPPSGTSVLKIQLESAPQTNYQGEVEIRSGNFHSLIPVRIFPAPARLEIDPPQVLKLGEIPNSNLRKGRFVVKNTGGSDAPVEILAPLELLVSPDSRNLILSAGQQQAFEVQLENPPPDLYSGKIRIQSRDNEPLGLVVEAKPARQNKTTLPVGHFLTIPEKSGENPGKVTPVPDSIPQMEKPAIVSTEPHEIVLTWKLRSPGASDFRIERKSIAPGTDGQVAIAWIPWQGARLSFAEGKAVANLVGLPANTFWTVRVVTLDPNGQRTAISPSFQIATLPLHRFQVPLWCWILLLLTLVAVLVRYWRKSRQSLHDIEDKRIAKLEGG